MNRTREDDSKSCPIVLFLVFQRLCIECHRQIMVMRSVSISYLLLSRQGVSHRHSNDIPCGKCHRLSELKSDFMFNMSDFFQLQECASRSIWRFGEW